MYIISQGEIQILQIGGFLFDSSNVSEHSANWKTIWVFKIPMLLHNICDLIRFMFLSSQSGVHDPTLALVSMGTNLSRNPAQPS